MFGGRSFMVNEKLTVSALKNGDLLVRIPADRHDELTALPSVEQAEMGSGRPMGPSWIAVAGHVIETEAKLAYWLEIAMDHNRRSVSD